MDLMPIAWRWPLGALAASAWSVACAGCAAPGATLQRYEYRHLTMGVEARIVLYAPDEAAARDAARAGFARLDALDDVMSDYRHESELAALSRTVGEAVPVSDDLFRVLSRAQEISVATGGAFDVTIGPLVALWREARQTGALPPAAEIDRARQSVGWQSLVLDAGERTVTLALPGMKLDLGGIGKGFAADEAARALAQRGARRCLVDVGGDLVARDPPPGRAGWRVAVERAGGDNREQMIVLANAALATSGDRYQFIEAGGERFSHLLDPRTGLGLTDHQGVTVRAADGATADALASALSVLGPERAEDILARFPGAEAWCDPSGAR